MEAEAFPPQTNTLQARLSAAENSLTPDLQHSSVLALIQLSLVEDLTSNAELSKLGSHPAKGDITSTSTSAKHQSARLPCCQRTDVSHRCRCGEHGLHKFNLA